jgi:hypothetical protein
MAGKPAHVTRDDEPAPRASEGSTRIYWHRDLPPLGAEATDEHVIEATSGRVQGLMTHRDELWDRCYAQLMENTRTRLHQEIERLGGDYAHVLEESIDSRRDDAAGEAWLHGRFTYVLYRNT